MIAALVAATAVAAPSREALVERWLHANPAHRAERLAGPPSRVRPRTPDLGALARRELSIPGRYRLTLAPAHVPPVPWWQRAWNWIAGRWDDLWRSIASRAHVGERAANAIGYALLALVGLTLLAVGVRLTRNVQRSRRARRAIAEPLEAGADPDALYREACYFANRGEFGNAALRLFAAAVAALSRCGLIAGAPSATVGDLRAALRARGAPLVPAFDAVAAPFVQTAYAERPIDAPQWQTAATAFDFLSSRAESRDKA
ncbi:MAG: hypothetical protein JO351_12235 [Candidatus Eremiobacteraeota bacterium]|nr:hypothetical protein [Candidatus Eremiobacteraeota bacterium]MBV9057391.1 hypothetical protein [Candidatus Eremiobacteraeota bacterium]